MENYYVIVDYTGTPVKFEPVDGVYKLKYTKLTKVDLYDNIGLAETILTSYKQLIKSDTETCSKNVVLPLRIVGAKKKITLYEL